MKSFKMLAIGLLIASSSAVFAAEPVPAKTWADSVKEWTYTPVKNGFSKTIGAEWNNGYAGKALVAGGLVVGLYGLTKVSDRVKSAWNTVRFNKVSDKVETTVQEAKENPKSKEGAIVGVTAAALLYAGLVHFNAVSAPSLPSFLSSKE